MGRNVQKQRKTTEAHDERRAEIIEHCAALFDKVGYHKASMQMVADEVGLGKPTLYHYFESKLAILYAIHDAHIKALLDGLETSEENDTDPLDQLRSACIAILRQIADHPGYVRAFMDHYGELEGSMRAKIREQRNTYLQRLRGIIAHGMEIGQFRETDPILTAYGFLGMCNWAHKWYPAMSKTRSPEDVADALCLPFFQGLSVQPTG